MVRALVSRLERPGGSFLLGAALASTLACSDPFGPDSITPEPDAPVQTSTLQYTLLLDRGSYRLLIPFTYYNRTQRAVVYDSCRESLQKEVNGAWFDTFAPVCPGIALASLDTIPPGGEQPSVFSITACLETEENCGSRFEITPIPGVYRIVLGLRFVGGDLLDGKDRVSNRFWLGLPSVVSQLPPN